MFVASALQTNRVNWEVFVGSAYWILFRVSQTRAKTPSWSISNPVNLLYLCFDNVCLWLLALTLCLLLLFHFTFCVVFTCLCGCSSTDLSISNLSRSFPQPTIFTPNPSLWHFSTILASSSKSNATKLNQHKQHPRQPSSSVYKIGRAFRPAYR